MIGSRTVQLQPTVRLQLSKLEQNTAVYAPMTFEEIVIVKIKTLKGDSFFNPLAPKGSPSDE